MLVNEDVVTEFSTSLFLVKYNDGVYSLSWHEPILEMLNASIYAPKFSAIDLVRKNAETSACALCHKSDTQVRVIAGVIETSVSRDTQSNHIVCHAFIELGLL